MRSAFPNKEGPGVFHPAEREEFGGTEGFRDRCRELVIRGQFSAKTNVTTRTVFSLLAAPALDPLPYSCRWRREPVTARE